MHSLVTITLVLFHWSILGIMVARFMNQRLRKVPARSR